MTPRTAGSWTALVLASALLSACSARKSVPADEASASEQYAVVHGWPVLPNHYRQGRASGVAVNSRNEVVLYHRADRSWLSEDGPISRPVIAFFDRWLQRESRVGETDVP